MDDSILLLDSSSIPSYICSGYRRFEPGKKHVNCTLNICMLVFVLEGTLFYKQDGIPGNVKEGEWFIEKPLSVMRVDMPCPKLAFYYIHFEPLPTAVGEPGTDVIFSDVSEDKPPRTIIRLPIRGTFEQKHMMPLFDEIESIASRVPSDIILRQGAFLHLISALAETTRPALTERDRLAADLYDYVVIHACKPFFVTDLEQVYHFSADYLSRLLKTNYGVTVKELVMQLRVRKARDLLSYTTLAIEAVSQQVGFQDVSQLHRAFKAHIGMSPGEYRRQRW